MENTDILMHLAKEQSDVSTNGGRMSENIVVSGIAQNVWDHVSSADRLSGKNQDRLVYVWNANDDDETMMNLLLFYDGDSLGSDYHRHAPVGQGDTQADWVSTPPTRWFSSGVLKTEIGPTDTTLTVVLANAAQTADFLDADEVIIVDKSAPDSGTGNLIKRTITGTPSISSNEVTFTVTQAFGFTFVETVTKICSGYNPGDIETSVETPTVTSTSGTFDETEVVLDNIGTRKQTLTFLFSSASAFTVSSDDVDIEAVGLTSGTIGSIYAPLNPANSKPYLTVNVAAWGGTFADGDEVELELNPSSVPQLQRRYVPSACPSLANNRLRCVAIAESET